MKGLDLSKRADQAKLLWIPRYPDFRESRTFVGGRQDDRTVYTIREQKLSCQHGGSWHDWTELGRDFANHGQHGIVEVDVKMCVICGKDKR